MTHSTVDVRSKRVWKGLLKKIVNKKKLARAQAAQEHTAEDAIDIQLFKADTIDSMVWPENEEGQFAQRCLAPIIKEGTNHFFDNIDVEFCVLRVGEHVFPLVISNDNYENSYVCSPYGHYISLALESLFIIKKALLKHTARLFLTRFGRILKKRKINKIVYVNHWLLSTDLYPSELSFEHVAAMTSFLKRHFPQHAIAFRSINSKTNAELKRNLENLNFQFIASRQIYMTDTSNQDLYATRIIKSDLKLWKESDYEIIESESMDDQDKERILSLYQKLAIENHSQHNPRLNLRFIQLMLDQKILQVKALKKNGSIDGVVGYTERNQILTCPFFGYDKTQQENPRLYRLLSTLLLLESGKKAKTFHQSAGASFYKTIRRAVGYTEYLSVYSAHLPRKQRYAWWLLEKTMNLAALPLMKKY